MNGDWNGFQVMAWIAWRNLKAVRVFSGEDAEQLWGAAKAGQFPKRLGRPKVAPVTAEMDLRIAMETGRIRYRPPSD
jgi:hypothetical protein